MKMTIETIRKALETLSLRGKTDVMVHSSLISFGLIDGVKPDCMPETFFSILADELGKDGTIYVPTFNYEFPSTRNADLTQQKSDMGSFAEYVRQLPQVCRSGHPMFSISAIGPHAQEVCQPTIAEYHPFDQKSTFARLFERDAYLLLQGVGLGVATVVVYFEYLLGSKCRFDKPFKGEVILQNGDKELADFYHYCFPLNGAYRENYQPIIDKLTDLNAIQRVKCGFGHLLLISFRNIYVAVKQLLAEDPFILLNTRPSELFTFKDGQEIAFPIN